MKTVIHNFMFTVRLLQNIDVLYVKIVCRPDESYSVLAILQLAGNVGNLEQNKLLFTYVVLLCNIFEIQFVITKVKIFRFY